MHKFRIVHDATQCCEDDNNLPQARIVRTHVYAKLVSVSCEDVGYSCKTSWMRRLFEPVATALLTGVQMRRRNA